MKSKKNNKDTSRLYTLQKELDALVQSDEYTNNKIKEKSKTISDLVDIQKKEDKGSKVFTIILLIIVSLSFLYISSLHDEKNDLEWYYNQVQKIVTTEDGKFSYRVRDGEPLTYDMLSKENDSLNYELSKYKTIYFMAKENYGITMKYSEEEKDSLIGGTIQLESLKLDSALVLLSMFRDKLKYNSKNGVWSIDLSLYEK